jgi:hypothetical protein
VPERFNDFHERIEATSTTDRLDDEEFTFTVRQFGLAVCKVIHRYSETPNGLPFYAETVVGVNVPVFGWILNWLVLPLSTRGRRRKTGFDIILKRRAAQRT